MHELIAAQGEERAAEGIELTQGTRKATNHSADIDERRYRRADTARDVAQGLRTGAELFGIIAETHDRDEGGEGEKQPRDDHRGDNRARNEDRRIESLLAER